MGRAARRVVLLREGQAVGLGRTRKLHKYGRSRTDVRVYENGEEVIPFASCRKGRSFLKVEVHGRILLLARLVAVAFGNPLKLTWEEFEQGKYVAAHIPDKRGNYRPDDVLTRRVRVATKEENDVEEAERRAKAKEQRAKEKARRR